MFYADWKLIWLIYVRDLALIRGKATIRVNVFNGWSSQGIAIEKRSKTLGMKNDSKKNKKAGIRRLSEYGFTLALK